MAVKTRPEFGAWGRGFWPPMPRIVQRFEVPENGGLGMVFWRSGATSIIAFTTAAEVFSCRGLEAVAIAASSFKVSTPPRNRMGVMDGECAVCHRAIQNQEQWFRVYEEYVHLSCAEKYLRLVSGRRQQAKTAPAKA